MYFIEYEPYGIILLIGIILILVKVLGELFERISLPAIFGEILLGVILGPILGIIELSSNGNQKTLCTEVIKLLGEIGAVFLLFLIGFTKIDIKRLHVSIKQALPVTVLGTVFPFIGGFIAAYLFSLISGDFASIFNKNSQMKGCLLIGIALSATSIGVSVRTLMDLRYIATKIGATVLFAAVLDDFLSIIILAVISGVITTDTISYLAIRNTLVNLLTFCIVVFLLGKYFFPMIARLSDQMITEEANFGIILGVLFAFSFLTEKFGLSMIIGAFLFGVSISTISRLKTESVIHKVSGLSNGFFIPFFFLNIGLLFDFKAITSTGVFAIILVVSVIASQIIGGFFGGKISKFSNKDSFIIGTALVPRNELTLVIITMGIKLGVLSSKVFSTIVLVTIITTIITPLLLKILIKKDGHQ